MRYNIINNNCFICLVSCSPSSENQDTKIEILDSKTSENLEKNNRPAIKIPTNPIYVAEAIPMLEEWTNQTISVSSVYIGSYGTGASITLRLMDSPESAEELECVFDINQAEALAKLAFGPITISGIVWNSKLVECKIVQE